MIDPLFEKSRPEVNTPEYKAFRYHVLSRDKWTCVKCGSKDSLAVHHIIPWSKSPKLRYLSNNGVTLCEMCHDLVTGKEEQYEDEFKRIVDEKRIAMGGGKNIKNTNMGQKRKWRPRNPYNRYQ